MALLRQDAVYSTCTPLRIGTKNQRNKSKVLALSLEYDEGPDHLARRFTFTSGSGREVSTASMIDSTEGQSTQTKWKNPDHV